MSESVKMLLFTKDRKEAEETIKTLKGMEDNLEYSYALTLTDFCDLLKKNIWDIIVFDCYMNNVTPDKILAQLEKAGSLAPAVAMIEETDIRLVSELTEKGCYNYVIKGDCNRLLRTEEYGLKLGGLKYRNSYTRKHLGTTLLAVSMGVISTDKEGRITLINSAASRLTGWEGHRAIGEPLEKVFHIIDAKTRERIDCPVIQEPFTENNGKVAAYPILITKAGLERYIHAQRLPLNGEEGQVYGSVITFQDFTDHRRISEELRIERNNLRNQFQYAPTGMAVVDGKLKIQSANDRFTDICHVSGEKVIGNTLCKSLGCVRNTDGSRDEGKNCHQCLIKKCIMQVIKSYLPLRDIEETFNLIRAGRTVACTFNCNFVPLKTGDKANVLISIDDITEQRIMEEKLIESRDFYLTLFEEFPTMIWRTDLTRGIDYVNKKMLEFTGREMKQELGTRWMDNLHPEDTMDYVEAYNRAFDERRVFEYDYRLKGVDGEYLWLSCYACPYCDMDGNFAGYIGTSYDITEKKKWEAEIKRAMEATKEAYKAKSEFLANMSHEIRTPLNGILGMIDLTLRTALTEEQKDNLNTAKNCTNSLLTVINDVLDFSKMEVGKLSLQNVEFDVRGLVNRIIRIHHIKASEKGIDLNYQMPADIPDFIIGDPNRLQQVLDNLINNAIKFTDEGFASLIIKTIEKTESSIKLRFSIVDSGIGISDSEMGRLFRSFSQINGSKTRRHGGTGLGLIISRNLIEMMGGILGVKSEKGRGSEFSFVLDFDIGKGNDYSEEADNECSVQAITDARILLVEDDEVNQKVIGGMLREIGYRYDVAGCGKDALSLLEGNAYDLCLMDIQMPGLDGVQTTALIRENEAKDRKPHMPIVAITAYALRGDRERFLAMGLDEYIAKPFQMSELYFLLEKLLMDKKGNIGDQNATVKRINSYLQDYAQSVRPTIEQMKNSIKGLKTAIEGEDLQSTEKNAHDIKGFAASISADKLKTIAFRIELAARRGDGKEAKKLLKALQGVFEKHTINTDKMEE